MKETFKLKIKLMTPVSGTGEQEETRGALWFDGKELERFALMSGGNKTIEKEIELEDGEHNFKIKHLWSPSSQSALIVDNVELDEINHDKNLLNLVI